VDNKISPTSTEGMSAVAAEAAMEKYSSSFRTVEHGELFGWRTDGKGRELRVVAFRDDSNEIYKFERILVRYARAVSPLEPSPFDTSR
jgi:hypothetical protein